MRFILHFACEIYGEIQTHEMTALFCSGGALPNDKLKLFAHSLYF